MAVLCFAANSLLCKLALTLHLIDPATFTMVRVLSAAGLLGAIVLLRSGSTKLENTSFLSVSMLFAYLVLFSFAYVKLSTGTGALILFGSVQVIMIFFAVRGGERLPILSWFALAAAIIGLVYLVMPGVTSPDPLGSALMVGAGVAWGSFSLLARRADDPLQANAANFIACILPVAIVTARFSDISETTFAGLILAVASGAFASGFGYLVWYYAVQSLSVAQAATVQLSVPIIAAVGGVAFLSEPITLRLAVASLLTLGGVAAVIGLRSKEQNYRLLETSDNARTP